MNRMYGLVLGGCALGALVLVGATPADARCSRVSASGVGLTRAMAMDMAKISVDTEIAFKGKKAAGRVHYACSMPVMTECKATRRAC